MRAFSCYNSAMKFKAIFHEGTVEVESIETEDFSAIRHFMAKHLPKEFNSIAQTAFMKGEAEAGVIARREWIRNPLTHYASLCKLSLERIS